METKIKKLEEHLNFIWNLIPNKPTYGEFNKVFPVKGSVEVLRNFEKENEWFGIARYDTKDEGITILSMFASITDFLSDGWRLSFETEATEGTPMEEQTITGFKMIKLDED
jgi:hypothetical protein